MPDPDVTLSVGEKRFLGELGAIREALPEEGSAGVAKLAREVADILARYRNSIGK
jgi:hypothetical protein